MKYNPKGEKHTPSLGPQEGLGQVYNVAELVCLVSFSVRP